MIDKHQYLDVGDTMIVKPLPVLDDYYDPEYDSYDLAYTKEMLELAGTPLVVEDVEVWEGGPLYTAAGHSWVFSNEMLLLSDNVVRNKDAVFVLDKGED